MRFRPRFSLRTLFVLIALFSLPLGWVAYQLNWIRQRHAFLSRPDGWSWTGFLGNDGPPSAPWPLRIFGETGYAQIIVIIVDQDRTMNEHDQPEPDSSRLTPKERNYIERIGRLFPEAHTFAWFRKNPMPSDQQRY